MGKLLSRVMLPMQEFDSGHCIHSIHTQSNTVMILVEYFYRMYSKQLLHFQLKIEKKIASVTSKREKKISRRVSYSIRKNNSNVKKKIE